MNCYRWLKGCMSSFPKWLLLWIRQHRCVFIRLKHRLSMKSLFHVLLFDEQILPPAGGARRSYMTNLTSDLCTPLSGWWPAGGNSRETGVPSASSIMQHFISVCQYGRSDDGVKVMVTHTRARPHDDECVPRVNNIPKQLIKSELNGDYYVGTHKSNYSIYRN